MKPPLCYADYGTEGSQGGGRSPYLGGLSGVGSPPLQGLEQHHKIYLFLDPILGWVNLYMVLCMVLDAMVFGPWYWMLWHV